MGLIISSKSLGFEVDNKEERQRPFQLGLAQSKYIPSDGLQWVISIEPSNMFLSWVFHIELSPTRTLQQIWFKGELIVILFGKLCSLSNKGKKKTKAKWAAD